LGGEYTWAGFFCPAGEEAGGGNKDIDEVNEAAELAGIRRAARFTPIGNVKE
jgi:hypothetical protein